MKKIISLIVCCFIFNEAGLYAQSTWQAMLHRNDSIRIPFHFTARTLNNKEGWTLRNAEEKIRVHQFERQGDSLIAHMPVFESKLIVQQRGNTLQGRWEKGGAYRTTSMPFTAVTGRSRLTIGKPAAFNISGRWEVLFTKNQRADSAVGIFRQQGSKLTGTFLTTTGDYRFLEGIVKGDSLMLSAFDGSHAFLFTAKIESNTRITGGQFYSGATGRQSWEGKKNPVAKVSTTAAAMYVKPGEEKLRFRFRDLDGQWVSMEDARFHNKVLLVQLMGSWCPNCMDETEYLSEYYNQNRQRGVEVVALAYEYSTDWVRSKNSLIKFRDRFNVQYPILNTEVTVTDSLRTEKTLPGLSPIRMFPSLLIVDKKGMIRKIETGFNGPGTGEFFLHYKKELEGYVNELLQK